MALSLIFRFVVADLASAMIASRIICDLIDRLEGEKDEDKVDYFVRARVIPRDRKDVQRQILTAMRLSRNFLAHRVDIFPETGDILTLLGGSFNSQKYGLNYQNGNRTCTIHDMINECGVNKKHKFILKTSS